MQARFPHRNRSTVGACFSRFRLPKRRIGVAAGVRENLHGNGSDFAILEVIAGFTRMAAGYSLLICHCATFSALRVNIANGGSM